LREHLGADRLDAFLDDGPSRAAEFTAADQEKIRDRVGTGNWLLGTLFALDLARYGYPLADPRDFTERQLTLAHDEAEFLAEVDWPNPRGRQNEPEAQVRREAEMTHLRELAMQLMTVRESPIWRTVERLDVGRRALSRVAALLLHIFH
jgi:hypothetical protein